MWVILQPFLFNIFIDTLKEQIKKNLKKIKEQIHCTFCSCIEDIIKDKGEWKIILRFLSWNIKNIWEGMIRCRRDTFPCWACPFNVLSYLYRLLNRNYSREYVSMWHSGPPVCANAGDSRDVDLIPGLGRSLGVGNGNPLQYSCLENFMDRGAWGGYSPRGHRVRHGWVTEHKHAYTLIGCL